MMSPIAQVAGADGIDVTVAVVGAIGIILGAALTAGLQVIGLTMSRRHALDDRRHDRKRRLYEGYVRRIEGLQHRLDQAVRKNTGQELLVAFAEETIEMRVGMRLDAAPNIVDLVDVVEKAVKAFLEQTIATPAGVDRADANEELFDEVVRPPLRKAAEAMAKELRSR